MSTKWPVASRMPVLTAAPLPLLYGWRTTRAPASAARDAVSSPDPSSTTRISCQRSAAASPRTTTPTDADSLNAGITTDVRPASVGSDMGHQRVHDGVPGDAAHAFVSGVAERARERAVRGEAVDRAADGFRARIADEAGDPVFDELERAAGVGRGDDRLVREERLERHVAVVLVERREHHRERAGVQLHEI